jgi:hypothetical protein
VIGQKQLEQFRDEMATKVNDAYTVLLREKKLPLQLLEDPERKVQGPRGPRGGPVNLLLSVWPPGLLRTRRPATHAPPPPPPPPPPRPPRAGRPAPAPPPARPPRPAAGGQAVRLDGCVLTCQCIHAS